jgi:frataxin-like iron-binding protein CyaY
MKSLSSKEVKNCIPTPSGCVEWNGGDIPAFGICDGDYLNNIILDILTKLQSLAGEDLSAFDLDSLLELCNSKAPLEVSLISILNVIKSNQICFKDYADKLSNQLSELLNESKVNIDLKCYSNFDNQGNALSITRDQLDQLIINELCQHEVAIDNINGKITGLQAQIDNLNSSKSVDELTFATCVDSAIKPTSSQVISLAQAHCDLENAVGTPANIQSAMSKAPSGWNTKYSTLPGWIPSPSNEAELLGNALLVIGNMDARITFMENNCCALSCEDIKLGFSAVYNQDGDGIVIKFSFGAGTSIPNGITDKGSTGTIKDVNGNVETFTLTIVNNYEVEVPVSGLDISSDLQINISAKLGTDALTCEKCLNKTVKNSGCGFCEITATGEEGGTAVIIYEDGNITGSVITSPAATTSTTSTTTLP